MDSNANEYNFKERKNGGSQEEGEKELIYFFFLKKIYCLQMVRIFTIIANY